MRLLPLPACGERVGVRGPLHKLGLAERPPHPARKSAPTSPRKRGEVKKPLQFHQITLWRQSNDCPPGGAVAFEKNSHHIFSVRPYYRTETGGSEMIIRLKLVQALRGMVVFSSIVAVAPALAQSSQRDGASTPAQPTILGPAMLRPGTADLSCGAGPAGLGPWGADRIEQTLSLDSAQRTKFNDLKTASQRAIQYLNESCPKNEPVTPTGRLEAMERRLSAMLEAVRTVQPALDDFYGALNDEQKARLTAIEPSDSTTSAPTDTAANTSTYRDRRGRVHQRHGGRPHFRFRLPLPIPF